MLTTVEAEIDTSGNVRLLEPVKVKKTTRAIVTLLEENDNSKPADKGNAQRLLDFLKNNRLPEESRSTPEQMEERIAENRNSWD